MDPLERFAKATRDAQRSWVQYEKKLRQELPVEGCERRGGVCDCGTRPCAIDKTSVCDAKTTHLD